MTLDEAIDSQRINGRLVWTICLLLGLQMLDGFDQVSLSFAVRPLMAQLHASPAAFGAVFGIGFAGTALGAIVFGPLADVWGRKSTVVLVSIGFGLMSLALTRIETIQALMAVRFISGLFLGGLYSPAITMAQEIAPGRLRVTLATPVAVGSTLGAALCGLVAALIIPAYGWRSLFYIGGAAPIVLALVCALTTQESVRFLASKPKRVAGARAALQAIRPDLSEADMELALSRADRQADSASAGERRSKPSPMLANGILSPELRSTTLLLCVAMAGCAAATFFLTSWLPLFADKAGLSHSASAMTLSLFSIVGVAGALLIARVLDRRGIGILAVFPLIGAAAMVAMSLAGKSGIMFLSAAACAGLLSSTLNAVASAAGPYYQVGTRAQAIGWLSAAMRLAAMVGPWVAGFMLGAGVTSSLIIVLLALPPIASALAIFRVGSIRFRLNRAVASER